jgi:hypothetical protein
LAVDESGVSEGAQGVEGVDCVADVLGELLDRVPLITGPHDEHQDLPLEVLRYVGVVDRDMTIYRRAGHLRVRVPSP